MSVRTNDININSGQLIYEKQGVNTYFDLEKIPYDRDDLILMLNDMDPDIQYENMGKYMRVNTYVNVTISATGNIMRLMGLYTPI